MEDYDLVQDLVSAIGTLLILWAGVLLERWHKAYSAYAVIGLIMIVAMGRFVQLFADSGWQ